MRTQRFPTRSNRSKALLLVLGLAGSTAFTHATEIETTLLDRWSLPMSEDAQGVVAVGNTLYVAASDDGLAIYDITDPNNPHRLGQLATTDAYDVAVDGNHAYIADYDDGLRIIDVSDPTAPVQVATNAAAGYAYEIAVDNGRAYLALESGGIDIIDVSTPTAPSVITNIPTSEYFYDVSVRGDYLYARRVRGWDAHLQRKQSECPGVGWALGD